MAIMKGVFTNIAGRLGVSSFCYTAGRQVIKSRPIASNPKTTAQTQHRLKFHRLSGFSKFIYQPVIWNVWGYQSRKRSSSWYSFLKYNLKHVETIVTPADVIFSKGSLENIHEPLPAYNPATSVFSLSWDGSTFGNGNPHDYVNVLIYNFNEPYPSFLTFQEFLRNENYLSGFIPQETVFDDLIIFIFTTRTDEMFQSISSSKQIKIIESVV